MGGALAESVVYLEQQPGVRHVSCRDLVPTDAPTRVDGAPMVLVVAVKLELAAAEAGTRLDDKWAAGTVVAVGGQGSG